MRPLKDFFFSNVIHVVLALNNRYTPAIINQSLGLYLPFHKCLHHADACINTATSRNYGEVEPPVAPPGYQVLSDILFRLGLIANCSHTVLCLDCSDLN